jgi:hypothetical protein
MKRKQFDWLGWPTKSETNHRIHAHKIRDGAACLEVAAMLVKQGYEYRDTLLNFPDHGEAPDGGRYAPLIVMVTRPPLTTTDEPKKKVQRSNSQLETEIIAAVRPFFEKCTRNQVILHNRVAAKFGSSENRTRVQIDFRQNSDWAWYKRLRGMTKDINYKDTEQERRTAGYLIFVPRIAKRESALLAVFGMGGNDTLVWCRILRDRYRAEIKKILNSDKPRFLMVELTSPSEVEPLGKFQTIGNIASRWRSDIIVDCALRA